MRAYASCCLLNALRPNQNKLLSLSLIVTLIYVSCTLGQRRGENDDINVTDKTLQRVLVNVLTEFRLDRFFRFSVFTPRNQRSLLIVIMKLPYLLVLTLN